MTKFHSDDYIRFLRSIRPDNMSEYNKQMQRCKIIDLIFIHSMNICVYVCYIYNIYIYIYVMYI